MINFEQLLHIQNDKSPINQYFDLKLSYIIPMIIKAKLYHETTSKSKNVEL